MKTKTIVLILMLSSLMTFAMCQTTDFNGTIPGPQAWKFLLDGNARFVQGQAVPPNVTQARLSTLLGGQSPGAIVVTCADSRVPPEIFFNVGLGDIFVIRVAGNAISPDVLGSVDYAVDHLGTNLIVIMGHQKCGAVSAALSEYVNHLTSSGDEELDQTLAPIFPSVKKAAEKYGNVSSVAIDYAVQQNALDACSSMVTNSEVVRAAMQNPNFLIMVAEYELHDGSIHVLGNSSNCLIDPAYKFSDQQSGIIQNQNIINQNLELVGGIIVLGVFCFASIVAVVYFWIELRRHKKYGKMRDQGQEMKTTPESTSLP